MDGKLTFENPNTTPFLYDYNATNVTQPKLRDAIVEVAVWSGETGLASAITSIFSDDFDAVTAPAGWSRWVLSNDSSVLPTTGLQVFGYGITRKYYTEPSPLSGYSGITVSFDMGTQMSGPGIIANAEWSPDGGTTWNLLKQINAGDPEDDNNLHPFTYSLPASADNNPAFTLRFSLSGPATVATRCM